MASHWPASGGILAQVEHRLGYLADIGLDYLTLDRPAANLATGELNRVNLTRTLGSGLVNTLYVLDEPTSGLHAFDVGRLIELLHRLRDQGNTLVVVEHDHDVINAQITSSTSALAPVPRAVTCSTAARLPA